MSTCVVLAFGSKVYSRTIMVETVTAKTKVSKQTNPTHSDSTESLYIRSY